MVKVLNSRIDNWPSGQKVEEMAEIFGCWSENWPYG